MHRNIFAILLFALLLAGCAATPTAAPAPTTQPVDANPSPSASPTPDPSIPRTAQIAELEGDVQTRSQSSDDFKNATRGEALSLNGELRSGEDGKALLKLEPEGTSIRLGPNSHLLLNALSPSAADPQTTLEILAGQLWVVLNGGTLNVDSASGLATVRGSMMSIAFDPIVGNLTVTCLEGLCSVGNQFGVTDLVAGQATEVPGPGQPPNPPRPISETELEDWRQQVPESAPAFDALANPPAPPAPLNLPGSGPNTATTEPITYSFNNLCNAVWHWEFDGPVNVQIDVAPNSTESGDLPPGIYQVHDWDDTGFDNGWYEVVGGSVLDVTHDCPDSQPPQPPGP